MIGLGPHGWVLMVIAFAMLIALGGSGMPEEKGRKKKKGKHRKPS